MLLAANEPPAAAALISRNSRRETLLFGMASPGLAFSSDERVSLTFTRHQEYPFLDDFARAGFVVPLIEQMQRLLAGLTTSVWCSAPLRVTLEQPPCVSTTEVTEN